MLVAAAIQILQAENVALGRVFGKELPQSEHASMPRKAAVVRGSGGSQTLSRHWGRTGDIRIDVRCYGATDWEAAEVEQEVASVFQALRQAVVTVNGEAVQVSWFSQSGGPNELTDPDTDWPYSLSSWQVFGRRY